MRRIRCSQRILRYQKGRLRITPREQAKRENSDVHGFNAPGPHTGCFIDFVVGITVRIASEETWHFTHK